jgi:hypothetical protein
MTPQKLITPPQPNPQLLKRWNVMKSIKKYTFKNNKWSISWLKYICEWNKKDNSRHEQERQLHRWEIQQT